MKIRGSKLIDIHITKEELAKVIMQCVYNVEHPKLYVADNTIFNFDGYGPYSDSKVSTNPDDIILVNAAKILEKMHRKEIENGRTN